MHGKKIKVIDTQQAKLRNNYKNTKLKLFKTNAAIWFNKMCRIKQLCILTNDFKETKSGKVPSYAP